MNKVLTLNSLNGETVTSDRADKNTLGEFSNKLDKICRKHGVFLFSELMDYTHFSLGRGGIPFPEGMSLNDEVMAEHGKWFDAEDVYNQLSTLKNILQQKPIRFGLFKDQNDQILLELDECINFIKIAKEQGYKVNISVTVPGGGDVHGVGYGHGF